MSGGPPRAARGALWMVLGIFLLATMDAIGKGLVADYPVPVVVWGRFACHTVFMVVWLRADLIRTMVTKRWALQLGRSSCLLGMIVLFYLGLRVMPLADANAILMLSPILVTLLSVPVLGEAVGPRRWAAVAAGCIGGLVIIRPGSGALAGAALFPFGSACFLALHQLATRSLSRTDGVRTTFAYTAVTGTAVTTAAVPFFWSAPDPSAWVLLAATGFFSFTGQYSIVKAFALAPAVAVAPLTYTILIWAALYGYALFGDVPDGWTLLGASIVTASGIYIFRRERLCEDGDRLPRGISARERGP